MKNVVNKCKSRNGSTLVENGFGVLVLCSVLALLLSVAPILNTIGTVDRMSNEVARYIEMKGEIRTADSEFSRLQREYNLIDSTSMDIDADTISGGKIQLGEPFTVIVNYKFKVGIGSFQIPTSIPRKATGRSEKYWKN